MTTKLEIFLATMPSKSTSELLALWLVHGELHAVVPDVASMRTAVVAIRTEIDRRIPTSNEHREALAAFELDVARVTGNLPKKNPTEGAP